MTKEDNLKEMAKRWPEYTLEELKKEQALVDFANKFKIKDERVAEEAKDQATGERIKVENLSKPIKDLLEKDEKCQENKK